jgi:hypothetical protein
MRYYTIVITNSAGKLITTPSSVPGSGATYTSAIGPNTTLPGALQVELDIPLAAYATPMGAALIRVWGISLQEIAQGTQLNPQYKADGTTVYFDIKVYGGMRKGLPLANPSQAGLLVQGSIQQAFGNWINEEQTLDLIIMPSFGSNTQPKNIVFNWPANTSMADAISSTLQNAFPQYGAPVINISSKLVLNGPQVGFYNTVEQFASMVKSLSAPIIGGTYGGVDIFFKNGKFIVSDNTVALTPKQIQFQDLIGQPTWISGPTIQFKCPIRADISIGSYVTMPQKGAIVGTGEATPSTALINLNTAFKGTFYVNQIRHVGNFRQPDAASWVTTFNASPLTQIAVGQ